MKIKTLQIGDKGEGVRELQMALSGFDGGVFDGEFGPATRMQVKKFQRDFMRVNATGKVDNGVIENIIAFGQAYPLNWNKIKCDCGKCNGFGNQKGLNIYRRGFPKIEAYYQYEYIGIHKTILWFAKAVMFYCREDYILNVNSGYRCSVNNKIHNRKSTNHHGKAVDLIITNINKDKVSICTNHAKKIIAINCNIQVGWDLTNKKSLEPSDISPTWIHLDIRSFQKEYLDNKFFVKDEEKIYSDLEAI